MRKWIVAWVLLVSIPIAYAANTALSNLSASGAIAGGNLFYVVQSVGAGGVKATATQIATYINSLFSGSCTATSGGALTCTDAGLSTSDITTNDASTSKHGFVPKLPNDATKFYNGTGAYTVPAGGGGTPPVSYVAGQWTPPWSYDPIVGGTAATLNTIRCHPVYWKETTTFSQIGARVSTIGAAGNFQLAIYNDSTGTGQHLPGTKIDATGNISTGATGVIGAAFAGSNRQLTAFTIYWACSNTDNSTVIFSSVNTTGLGIAKILGSATPLSALTTSGTVVGKSCAGANCNGGSSTFNTWPDLTGTTWTELTTSVVPAIAGLIASVP